MFDTLCAVFERKSVATQVLLRKQLLMMKYNESDDMIDYLLQFDKRIRELKSTGATMEELDIVVHLLITMPKGYDNFVTALETMDQSKLTVEFVKTRLMDEYNKRTGGNVSIKSSTPGAMVAGSKQVVCYLCKKPGHKKAQCFRNKGNKKEKSSANEASDGGASTMCAVVNDDIISNFVESAVHDESIAGVVKSTVNDDSMMNFGEAFLSSESNAFSTNVSGNSNFSQIKFCLDSGATQHMVNDKRYFDTLNKIDELSISVAKKNQSISAKERGNILVKTFHEGDTTSKTMENVLLVNDLKCNLMSIRSLCQKGYRIVFEGDYAYASIGGKVKFIGRVNGKLYEVILHVDNNVFAGFTGEKTLHKISHSLWHFRLAHLNATAMKKLVNRMADGLDKVNVDSDHKLCESCVLGKHTRLPFPKNKNPRSSRVLELIHSDVCGKWPTKAYDGSEYFVTFTDDYSRASIVYCVKNKSEVLGKFKEFVAMAEAFHGKKVAKLKSDNGGEYKSMGFEEWCKEKGIQTIFTVSYNPEMNSVSERLNRTLEEKANTMLLASGLDDKFWNEAIITANYIKNRSPTSAVGKQFEPKTPAEIWFGTKPNLSNLRIFGCECYNHVPAEKRSKLQPKARKCVMLGYGSSFGTYRIWDIEQRKLIFGRNITFNEASVLTQSKLIEITDSEADIPTANDDKRDELQTVAAENGEINSTNRGCVGNGMQLSHGVDLDSTGDVQDKNNSAIEECIGDDQENIHSAKGNCIGNVQENVNSANKDCIGNVRSSVDEETGNGVAQ